MEGGQPLLDYYSLLTIIFWFAINILIWGIIIILHKVHSTSTASHEDTSVVNKVVPDDGIDDDTITGTDDDIDERELLSWYLAITSTKPLTNPFPKTDYRLNLRNACKLPTMLELPVTEKLEEVGIEEYYNSEVCTADNNVMTSTTVDGSDNDDNFIGDEEIQSWHSAVAATKSSPNPWPNSDYRLNYRNACKLPTMLEEMEEVGIDECYYSEVCTGDNVMNSTTVDNDDGGGVIHEDYENDDGQWITYGHSCDCEDTTMDSMKKIVTDGIESECEICVGQSFGPRDDGYDSMIGFVKEEQVSQSERQIQPFKENLKESVIKHVVELDETLKTIENIVDVLEEEHQAEMMEQQKKFDQELKVKLDQAKASEQQMQLFKERVKEGVIKRLVELEEGFKIVWKMVDVLVDEHQVDMVEQKKTLEEEFGRKLVEQENIMIMQQKMKSEEDKKKFEEEMYAKLADPTKRMEAKKEEQEIQGLSKHFTFTLTEAQQSQVDEIEKQFDEKISKTKETYKKKSEVLKEKNKPDLELQSQYLIEDKEWKFCKYRRRFNKKLRKLVKTWKKKNHKVGVASPTEQ